MVAVTSKANSSASPARVVAKAVSAASRPVAMRTSDERGARRVGSRTMPDPVDPGLDHGVEVHRAEAGGVHRGQAGRDPSGPAQGHREVGEVPAGAGVGRQRVSGPRSYGSAGFRS